jgi:hypothetical protein
MRRRLLALAAAALAAAAGSAALIYILGAHRVLEIPTDWPWDGHADLAAQGALALLATQLGLLRLLKLQGRSLMVLGAVVITGGVLMQIAAESLNLLLVAQCYDAYHNAKGQLGCCREGARACDQQQPMSAPGSSCRRGESLPRTHRSHI